MSQLFNVIFAWKCTSTHQKMAMDALNQLRSSQAESWRNLCLGNVDRYLEGSKAPDNKFKDFRNHVLHVRENHWGGAVASAERWYGEFVTALKSKKWSDAVYAAGVLSHYYTDPIQPLHTAQCEAEGVIHQACEWSIACAYRELTGLLESDLGGWPIVTVPNGQNWLGRMVTDGADLANPHYEACLEHYNLAIGAKNPPGGLDQDLRIRFARLIGHAVVGFAGIVDRALEESQAEIPVTNLTLQSVISTISIPIYWVTKKMADAKERALVESIYREYQQTGKVVEALSADDKSVRETHAAEVRKISPAELDAEPVVAIGTAHGTISSQVAAAPNAPAKQRGQSNVTTVSEPETSGKPSAATGRLEAVSETTKQKMMASFTFPIPANVNLTAVERLNANVASDTTSDHSSSKESANARQSRPSNRYYLDETMDIEKAPSIGPKTADRLRECGIHTIHDLIHADAVALATQIDDRNFNQQVIEDWQDQARLCCEVLNLRGHDAQILVATGVRNRAELAVAQPTNLLTLVEDFANTSAGKRILRGGQCPDAAEINDWISWARMEPRTNAA